MNKLQKRPADHLIIAYNQMMTEMRLLFDRTDPNNMSLQKALELAKDRAVHLGEISAEEANEIGEYIKRDINDAAEYMMDSSAEFYDWLLLDIEIIERKVMELFLSVADSTRVELEQFKQKKLPELTSIYRTGEATEPCTLICENCGKTKLFLSSGTICQCERCEHNRFIRRQYGHHS